jgi:hypothetical protein
MPNSEGYRTLLNAAAIASRAAQTGGEHTKRALETIAISWIEACRLPLDEGRFIVICDIHETADAVLMVEGYMTGGSHERDRR